MIFGTLIHTVYTIHVSCQPSAVFGKGSGTVTHAVRFDVCFINHVQSVAVAKLIPIRMGGIMRVTDKVDVMLFHQFDIQFHKFLAHRTSEL